MKKSIHINFEVVHSHELTDNIKALIVASEMAVITSHAPYSKFHVGAALLLDNGKIVKGSNQENASFPIGFCAERTALSGKIAVAPNAKVEAIAISVLSESGKILPPIPPCGMCRQALLEEETKQDQPIKVYLSGNDQQVIIIDTIKDLLPFQFNGSIFNE
ncbi:MAG: cytidine deaminase [Chitinophagales bacterium]